MKLLHLDSSVTGPYSVSRTISAEIVEALKARHPGIEVIYHDLVTEPAMHLSPAHLAAFQGGEVTDPALGADLARGGAYLQELLDADILVIGVAMYNLTVPTQLKAWIDRVAVAGQTFRYTETGPEGLLPKGKKIYFASARGGFYSGDSPAAAMDFHETYLRAVFALLGATDVEIIRAEGIGLGPDARQAALDGARREIAALAPALAA